MAKSSRSTAVRGPNFFVSWRISIIGYREWKSVQKALKGIDKICANDNSGSRGCQGVCLALFRHPLGRSCKLCYGERVQRQEVRMEQSEALKEVVAFHGHICPGIAYGYRVAETAL
ncbi:MAG: FmdE family protein, partial [bacterium]|nr:FmdE family protein [bacterium]